MPCLDILYKREKSLWNDMINQIKLLSSNVFSLTKIDFNVVYAWLNQVFYKVLNVLCKLYVGFYVKIMFNYFLSAAIVMNVMLQ